MIVNIWHPSQHSKTTLTVNDAPAALDAFCRRHGYVDHADYCRRNELTQTNLNCEIIRGNSQ